MTKTQTRKFVRKAARAAEAVTALDAFLKEADYYALHRRVVLDAMPVLSEVLEVAGAHAREAGILEETR